MQWSVSGTQYGGAAAVVHGGCGLRDAHAPQVLLGAGLITWGGVFRRTEGASEPALRVMSLLVRGQQHQPHVLPVLFLEGE